MASCDPKYLFVISFTVGKEAGIALVAAGSERQAFEILQNSGNYNGFPEKYVLVQSRNIGLIASVAYGLLIESYVNALEAYDAIIKAANKLIGPKGDTGEKGEKGDTGDVGPAGVTSVRVTVDQTTGYPYAETSLIGGVLSIIFHGIKGEKGEKGERGDMGDISFDDVPTEGSDNLLTSGALYIAFNDKVSVIPGKGLSTNDYTNADKNKLAAIESGAQKNVKSDWNVASGDAQILNKPDLSNFVTKSVNDLTNYYTKSQTFTKEEVQSLIAGIRSFTYELVSVLPTASASTLGAIYLVPSSDPQTQNVKDEFITVENSGVYTWEQIGSTAVDLSDYVTTTALNTALANYIASETIDSIVELTQAEYDALTTKDPGVMYIVTDPDGVEGDPVGILSVEQTTTSTVSDGVNVVTVTKTDGTTSTFQVKNGSQGENNELSIGTVIEGNTADALIIGDSPSQQLNLTLPKAGNPFQGLWDSFAALKNAVTAQSGFYAYVLTTNTSANIYLYDSSASSNQYWKDSGISIDLNDATVKPFSESAKNVLLYVLSKVAWIDENGQQYLDALSNALLIKQPVSIDATFTQGSSVYGTNTQLSKLKENLVVTAVYADGTTGIIPGGSYELSGTLSRGTSTITVTFNNVTDTFTVNVVRYVLEKDQFVCNGLTGNYSSDNGPYPYTAGSYTNRFSYPFFDLSVTPGVTYQFSVVSSYNTINIGVQGLTQEKLTKVEAHQNFTGVTDSSWKTPTFTYEIPSGVIVVRITGRRDSTNPNLTEVPVDRVIIDDVD